MPIRVVNVRDHYAQQTSSQTIKMLVAGEPGAGKTRFGSTFPEPLYLNMEGGLLSVRDRDVSAINIRNWSELEEAKSALMQTANVRLSVFETPIHTVVVDTVDEMARLCMAHVLQRNKHDKLLQGDWGDLGEFLRTMLRDLRNIDDLNVLFNVHLRSTKNEETGRVEYRPDIPGQVGDQIAQFPDDCVVLKARRVTDPVTNQMVLARILQTFPDSEHTWVKNRTGVLPAEFPVNFEDDYDRISKLVFEGRIAVPPPAPTAPETAPETETETPTTVNIPADVTLPEAPPVPTEPDPTPEPEPEPQPEPEATVPENGTQTSPDEDPLADLGEDHPLAGLEHDLVAVDPEEELGVPDIYDKPRCTECGAIIDPPEYAQFSMARFKVELCRDHFVARKKGQGNPQPAA